MATNYTNKYELCQWEAQDQVNRLEFNQDNARIEAGLLEMLTKVEDMKSLITSNVTSLENQISLVSNSISNVETSLSKVEGNLTTLEGSYTTLNSSLSTVSTRAESAYTLASTAKTTASSAYSSSNPCFALGCYTGTGSARAVTVGFMPRVGIVLSDDNTLAAPYQSVASRDLTHSQTGQLTSSNDGYLTLTTTGFFISAKVNYTGMNYIYMMFR